MPSESRFMVCKRIRANNGIVEGLFTRVSDHNSQEEHTLINWVVFPDRFKEGSTYLVEISLAAPTERS